MSANDNPVQRTHFADDATLAYIAQLERERARLINALENVLAAHSLYENGHEPAHIVVATHDARRLITELGQA